MKNTLFISLLALTVASCSGPNTPESKLSDELDAAKESKFLDTHFARYGTEKNKSIIREPSGYRFRLPASAKGTDQTGVNSFFQLAGDFEFSVIYELLAMTPPEAGYGVTCGIAVDTEGPAGNVQLMRGYQMGNVDGYIISRGKPASKEGHFLDTNFARYGHDPDNSITREESGFRFKLPDMPKGVNQTGVLSQFELTGDFEVAATYELLAVSPPKSGYGVTCGIAVDSDSPAGNVSLARGYPNKKANAYVMVHGKPKDGAMKYEGKNFPATSPKGKLILKRVNTDLIGRVADNPEDDNPRTLFQIPFTDGNIKKVRFFADNGGSEGAMDARIANIKIDAANTIDISPTTGRMIYNSEKHTTKAQSGRLVIRREKKELVCLVADKPDADDESLKEIARFPFTEATIKKVRVFADSGGSVQAMDARIGDIKLQAEEITGAMAKRDRPVKWGWWVIPGAILILGAGVIGFVIYRRKRAEEEE